MCGRLRAGKGFLHVCRLVGAAMCSACSRGTQAEHMAPLSRLPTGRKPLPTRSRPHMAAGSTGRRNTGVKFLCRGFKSQGLAWPLIELAGHFVEMGLRVHRQVGSFRKILSQQAIGVLVGTALPWTLRIAKVNIDVGR